VRRLGAGVYDDQDEEGTTAMTEGEDEMAMTPMTIAERNNTKGAGRLPPIREPIRQGRLGQRPVEVKAREPYRDSGGDRRRDDRGRDCRDDRRGDNSVASVRRPASSRRSRPHSHSRSRSGSRMRMERVICSIRTSGAMLVSPL